MINRNKNKIKFIQGFTLIELIISGAIIFLVSLTVYSVLAGGINVWKRASQASSKGHDLRLVLEKLSAELRNTFKISSIPFEGTKDVIAFASVIDKQVSRVSYFLNDDGIFCRRVQNYAEIFKKGESGKYYLLLPVVMGLEFSYCYLDNATGDYKWKDEWVKGEQDTIPQAVNIELVFKKDSQESKFTKTIFIPIGTGEQKIEFGQ
ncbi:MAG: prepilin-type N-terminal cleavage/methylation domain-containing protein [Candidatus Omnitrophica bacterium]|nr:prepilin-type N-terminal cleavage/methylation domain-containing protein [Candidatus Omnitrophota bacterium]MBU1923865.1 prepilin-type N-terminal cleavage/methylation domain-containing protein [Candidatus Omnitrophota bacterium]